MKNTGATRIKKTRGFFVFCPCGFLIRVEFILTSVGFLFLWPNDFFIFGFSLFGLGLTL